MSADVDLADLAAFYGIFDHFRDLDGVMRPTNPETQRALLRANGLAVATAAETREVLTGLHAAEKARPVPSEINVVCDTEYRLACKGPLDWHVLGEGSDEVLAEGRADAQIDLPPLPMGVHELKVTQAGNRSTCVVIAAPSRTPSLREVAQVERVWGVVAALYGLRSPRNRGLGDFEDLGRLGETLGPFGANFLGINPVHALGWGARDVISPYSPTHRGFLNTLHLALDGLAANPEPASPARCENDLIDYAAHGQEHRAALRAAYASFQTGARVSDLESLQNFTRDGGDALLNFARFESLSTRFGQDWRCWPEGLQSPEGVGVAEMSDGVDFHIWLQWLADRQLQDAHRRAQDSGMALGLYLDLAVGARLDGAEAWAAAGTLARGVSLGAPPDHLSPAGQNWQLAAYAPRKLAAAGYAPVRQVLRQAMRHCGVLRIDHALGLNRSYWIPDDGSPGGYIRQPFQSLMGIIAIEAHRAGTLVVGEDLGLVPEGFRDTMAAQGYYGYSVLQYEKAADGGFRDARDMRAQSMACFGTHDTPTIAGFWSGQDIGWWHKLGWIDDTGRRDARKRRAREKADLLGKPETALKDHDAADLREAVHRNLAEGAAALVAVQLDDLLGVQEAQNLPGTVDEHPNWRRKSPLDIADLAGHETIRKTAQMMADTGRGELKTEI